MKSLIVLVVCLVAVGVHSARLSRFNEWNQYKEEHGKVYESPEEDARRFSLYLTSKQQIEEHNAKNLSYKLGLNHLSDWTREELSRLNGFRRPMNRTETCDKEAMEFLDQLVSNYTGPLPEHVDWREHPGRVSSIKDQKQCGSCWAFSTVGAIEGQEVFRKHDKKLSSLSPQELVDCSKNNYGCQGGYPLYAFQDIQKLGGVETLDDYPYNARNNKCRFVKEKAVISDDGAYEYLQKGEEVLKKLVATYGPVSVGVQADTWFDYKSGIYESFDCMNELDHAVLIVGYGTDEKSGVPYWIVKNSWGEKWGEKGYMHIKRGAEMCGLGDASFIPKWN